MVVNIAELRERIDKEIIPTKDISFQKILNNLINVDENLILKTHIHRPKQITKLMLWQDYLESINYPITSKLIENFIDYYLKCMVSYNRIGRKEIIEGLSAFNQFPKNRDILNNDIEL